MEKQGERTGPGPEGDRFHWDAYHPRLKEGDLDREAWLKILCSVVSASGEALSHMSPRRSYSKDFDDGIERLVRIANKLYMEYNVHVPDPDWSAEGMDSGRDRVGRLEDALNIDGTWDESERARQKELKGHIPK